MEIKITGIEAELRRVRDLLKLNSKQLIDVKTKTILSDLIAATPIDTGAAREAWHAVPTPTGSRITNDVPYIEELNCGHSKQAPSYFIEKVLLSHGKAIGAILTKTPD